MGWILASDTGSTVAVATAFGAIGAALVTGVFALLTARTTVPAAKAAKVDVQALGTEVAGALEIVSRVLDENTRLSKENRKLRRELSQARRGGGA